MTRTYVFAAFLAAAAALSACGRSGLVGVPGLTPTPSPTASLPPGTPHVAPGDLAINEVYYDLSQNGFGGGGCSNCDANHDGSSDAVQDEFVEAVNVSGHAIDLGGMRIQDQSGTDRHVFAAATVLTNMQPFVVFGGGTPAAGQFGSALVRTASSGSLSLNDNNGGDEVTFLLGSAQIATVDFRSGQAQSANGRSLTRDPDLGATWASHPQASDPIDSQQHDFSPGFTVDYQSF